jgi:hypothetical protein
MAVTATRYRNPSWWNAEYDSGWERTKAAFRRDWDQTKHDFGGDEPDLNQDVNDTVGQAAGKKPIPPPYQPNFDEYEPAVRFGWGARRYYGNRYSSWNNDLESQLRNDWQTTAGSDMDWNQYRAAVRRGWEYNDEF